MSTNLIKEQKQPRFTFYHLIEGIEGVFIIIACYLTLFLKPVRDSWGLSKEEAKRTFPGDEWLAQPSSQFTHAVEINAPAEKVWCWIAQMGQGRGGFYSYEALENLTGMNIYNSDEILPEFQNPQIGDLIPFGPADAYPLVLCEPGKAMTIGFCYDLDKSILFDQETSSYPSNYFCLSWLWYVEPIDNHRSRFFSRNRIAYPHSFKNKLIFGLLMEPIVFAMDRKMCLGIKKRAEKLTTEKN
jgi:hypothetical protein